MRDEHLPVRFLSLQRRKVKWKLFLQKQCLCRNLVRKFHNALFYVACPHFTVDVTRLLLSSRFSLLVINLLTILINARFITV